MSYVNIRRLMLEAEKGHYAVGAFNIFNYQSARAAVRESENCRSPLILQTSVKTVKYYGPKELARILIPMAEQSSVPVAIHLDHCKDLEFAKTCTDNGWNSIMYDGSSYPLDINIKNTKAMVDYVKGRNIAVEGELGAIAGVEEDVIISDRDGSLADTKLSVRFTKETGVDAFAPAIGTAHGVYKGHPKLDMERFSEIKSIVNPPLVVHGGTGLSEAVFKELIRRGASKINVSTALKLSYLDALSACKGFTEPLKAEELIETRIRETIREFIWIFGSGNRV